MNNLHLPIGQYYKADWYEYIKPTTTEDEATYEAFGEEFYYSEFVNEKGVRFPLPGLRTSNAGLEITIQTDSDLPFKPQDKIKFHNGVIMYIKSIQEVFDTDNELAVFQFDGGITEYRTYVIRFNS